MIKFISTKTNDPSNIDTKNSNKDNKLFGIDKLYGFGSKKYLNNF